MHIDSMIWVSKLVGGCKLTVVCTTVWQCRGGSLNSSGYYTFHRSAVNKNPQQQWSQLGDMKRRNIKRILPSRADETHANCKSLVNGIRSKKFKRSNDTFSELPLEENSGSAKGVPLSRQLMLMTRRCSSTRNQRLVLSLPTTLNVWSAPFLTRCRADGTQTQDIVAF